MYFQAEQAAAAGKVNDQGRSLKVKVYDGLCRYMAVFVDVKTTTKCSMVTAR
jgi:hypothetical protein